jgi:hypothetical protein
MKAPDGGIEATKQTKDYGVKCRLPTIEIHVQPQNSPTGFLTDKVILGQH